MRIANNITELIGQTPMVKLNRIVELESADIYLKLESFNPGGSVKDRIANYMIEIAEKEGKLKEGGTIIEPTSGNTGIGLAMVGAAKGYNVIMVMPDTMSLERRNLLKAYGAKLILTPGELGMRGAIEKANQLAANNNNYFVPQQFDNPNNPEIHSKTTAQEILTQMEGKIDAFVAGIGTGGTITGVGNELKKVNNDIKIVAVEPFNSAVLSGETPSPHKIQGLGAGFVPSILNTNIYDQVYKVKDEEAMNTAKELATKEGILCGISTGAATYTAIQIALELGKGNRIVVIAPDTGERYLSTPLFTGE
ncbi:MAG TPA: cysteine synthase A [Eubacteriaceae bacterium]|nr:cysteine synthase A [Eubacteriaceae bacterium]